MDAESAFAAAGGIVAGGGLVTWFAKSMFDRLIRQLDAVVVVVSELEKGHAAAVEHTRAMDEKVDRLIRETSAAIERIASVSQRAEGLSVSYGPKLDALRSDVDKLLERRRRP